MKANAPSRHRSPQCVYAECLRDCRHRYGYPLLSPKPSSTLEESYRREGLKIGDVGYVNPDGVFYVCCNICCEPDAKINRDIGHHFRYVELNKTSDVEIDPDAIPSPMVIKSPDVTEDPCDNLSAPRTFRSRISPGAVLILPSGARFENVQDSVIERFRNIAEKHGYEWCTMSPSKSVLLITGLYKARSWSLGYFDDPPEKIIATPQDDQVPPEKYTWKAETANIFPRGHNEGSGPNQTIFLRGFRVTKKEVPVACDRSCLSMLWAFVNCLRRSRAVEVRDEPMFTRPFDFSEEINRRLLQKTPAAEVAIIHDDEWTHMLNEGDKLCEVLVRVDRIAENLLQNSSVASMNGHGVVSLRNKISYPSPAKPVPLSALTVVKTLRVGNAFSGLRRIPFGFYIEVNDGEWRTTTKSPLVNNPIIEWIEELPLLSEKVRISLCVVFGFDPILSGRESLHTVELRVQDLAESTYHVLEFSPGEVVSTDHRLFLTLGERPIDHLKARSDRAIDGPCRELSPTVVNRTKLGHDALARYYQDYMDEDIKEAVDHFECALNDVSREDCCYAIAVSNLATAKLNSYLLSGTSEIETCSSVISSYQTVLELLPAGHFDRPAILLCLAQALLYCYGRQGYNSEELAGLKVEVLMNEVEQLCPRDSHAYQAMNLILQTYKRHKFVRSNNLESLEKLLQELDSAVRLCPEGYFDKPHRLINLGIALRIRSQHRGDFDVLGYINKSVKAHEEAIRLIPPQHPDKATYLISLSAALLSRFRNDPSNLSDLSRSIEIITEVEQLVPEGHVDRAACLNTFAMALLQRFEQNFDSGPNPIDFSDINRAVSLNDEALRLIRNEHPDRATYLHALAVALRRRFDVQTDKPTNLTDINRSISLDDEASRLIPSEHPSKATYLYSLGAALLMRFDVRTDHDSAADLDRHIATLGEILRLVPSSHPDRAKYQSSFDSALQRRLKENSNGFRWPNIADRIDAFSEGPHYGPVLEPFLAKVVGASIELNPLLAPPTDTQYDYLRWNMLFHAYTCYRRIESQRPWIKGWNAPATHPRVSHIRVISRAFPWLIHAHAQNPTLGVTCGEVLDAVSTSMHGLVAKKEYEDLSSDRKHQITESYRANRSANSNVPEGLKRLDWLGSSLMFGGLVLSDAFVKEHCGDVLPCTFELRCLPS